MKTIGMIGGMSWESSIEYYRLVNEGVKKRLGGVHSAECIMYSVDFHRIEEMQHSGDWDALAKQMIRIARKLENAGADCIVICTNTMHLMAEEVEHSVDIPLLHIADVAAKSIKDQKLTKVGLLGTKFTMEKDFYSGRLQEKHGIDVIIPDDDRRQIVHDVIYNELVVGEINEESREKYIEIITDLQSRGAQAVVLGCTEIPLLVKQDHSPIPLLDTTTLHAEAAVDFALV